MRSAIISGYLPAAMAFGVAASTMHLPWPFVALLSAFVYSGALQSAAIGLLATGANPAMVITVGILINLRHMLYGPHLEAIRSDWARRHRFGVGALLTDEVYAAAVHQPTGSLRNWSRLAVAAYGTWQAGTWLGIGAIQALPHQWLRPLLYALPALFAGLSATAAKKSSGWVAAGFAASLAVALRLLHGATALMMVPIIVGTTAGYWSTRAGSVS
ncbi:MAG: AzlC family ABC transporter permease [Thermaerobacter sp.]|nr:AzlC family ABC transporter permease [Thermaerobacter sp.]